MKSILLLLILSLFQSAPSSVKKEQEYPKKGSTPTQEAPKPTAQPTSPATSLVSPPSPNTQANVAKDKSNGWPTWTDIFWPSWVLVMVTAMAVYAALRTLGSINAQVTEMRETGKQTDKLIAENIAQSQFLRQQAEFLGKSAYHLGESVAEANRSASAMESIAEKIAVSSKAALASVTAINQQMRAYICVVIGTAIYQDMAKNLKFQAVPAIVNAGLTPAHKVSFKAAAAILPVPLPQDFGFPLPPATSGTSVVGPRQNITVTPCVEDFCDDGEVEGIKSGTQGKALYVWGIFTYEDIFGNPQYTKFCHMYTWLADGKTTWGYYADRHNDAS